MNEQVAEFLKRPWVIPTAIGIASFVSGTAVGYFASQRMAKATVDELLGHLTDQEEMLDNYRAMVEEVSSEIEEMTEDLETYGVVREFESDRPDHVAVVTELYLDGDIEVVESIGGNHPSSRVLTPQGDPSAIEVDEEAKKIMDDLIEEHGPAKGFELYEALKRQVSGESEEAPEEEKVRVNVFGDDPEWDLLAEQRERTEDAPYVISKEEYNEEQLGFSQDTLTYYAGDDILVDATDVPIYNHEEKVGEMKFGHGSDDPLVVYIRNHQNKAEYEILRESGSFQVEVMGLDALADIDNERQLSHSTRRFRQDD